MTDQNSSAPESVGLPLKYDRHFEYCSTSVDDLTDFIRDTRATQRALRLMGAQLSRPLGVVPGFQKFELQVRRPATTRGGRDGGHGRDREGDKQSPASTVHNALATVARTHPPERSVDAGSADIAAASEAGATAEVNGLDVELLCQRLRQGPKYVLIGDKKMPWRACAPEEPPTPPQARPELVTLEPVAQETHLLTPNERYRGEDAAEILGVHVGETVLVEDCESRRVLFAGPNALRLQGELELPMPASDS